MTRIIVQNIVTKTGSTIAFQDRWSANGWPLMVDSYGVIKTGRDTIENDVTIPAGTNGFSAGPVKIKPGVTVTVQGEWSVV